MEKETLSKRKRYEVNKVLYWGLISLFLVFLILTTYFTSDKKLQHITAVVICAFAIGIIFVGAFFLRQQEKESTLEESIRNTIGEMENFEEPKDTIKTGWLFNLYSKQLERYQHATRLRATWSFFWATLVMAAGMGFIFWGGSHILIKQKYILDVVAGSLIATIGGGISAYITKTFLNVHRLSLMQLNHYFQQPMINEHILTVQRLANELNDSAKEKAYEVLIDSVIGLISYHQPPIYQEAVSPTKETETTPVQTGIQSSSGAESPPREERNRLVQLGGNPSSDLGGQGTPRIRPLERFPHGLIEVLHKLQDPLP